ncbi:N-acetylmuramoyl-L-alanine amidase [bacterium]|nr:N-acetylmuramoyl-L-alanine amidase [bacterium]
MRLLFTLLLLVITVSFCQAQVGEKYSFRGDTYQLTGVVSGGKTVLLLDDPEVKRLISATSASLQMSTSGRTLYVFLPGRESSWSDGSGVYTKNGQEFEAPGQFLSQPASMERAALLEALGLRAYTVSGGFQLASLVTDLSPIAPDSLELKIVTSAPLKFSTTEPEKGLFRVQLSEGAWERPERQFRLGESDVTVTGGDSPANPLVLEFRFQSFWAARVRLGLTREILVSPEPRQYTAPSQPAVLSDIRETANPDGTRELEFVLDKGVQFFWAVNPTQRILRVEFPSTSATVATAKVLRTANFPVSRYEVTLAEGQGFEFFQNSDQPTSLRLKVGPQAALKPTEAVGTATMSGYIGGRGSIALDAGHGGGDPGCCNRALGVYEKDVTLDICLRLQQILTAQGWRVEMTRTSDRDVTYAGSPDLMELQARADVGNRGATDLFVSIHCNASVSPNVRGSSVYWWKPEDRALAECLDVLGEGLGFEADGLIQNSFAVLRLSSAPAVLVETAFLTNPTEGSLLATPQVRQAIAERLAEGLGRYMAGKGGSGAGRSSR